MYNFSAEVAIHCCKRNVGVVCGIELKTMRKMNCQHISTSTSTVGHIMVGQDMVGGVCSIPNFTVGPLTEGIEQSALHHNTVAQLMYLNLQ